MTRAIILAAGQGTRLRPLTNSQPKCLVELLGKSLLKRQIETLNKCGVTNILVAGGFMIDKIREAGYECSENTNFMNTNMIASLFSAKSFMSENEDLVIGYGDIVYQSSNLISLLDNDAEISVMVDVDWQKLWALRFENPLSDAETLNFNDSGYIMTLGNKPDNYDQIQGQYTGLIKIRSDKVSDFIRFHSTKDFSNHYMTYFLQSLIDAGWKIKAIPVNGGWLEVDSVNDLDAYENLHKIGLLSSYYQPDA